MPDAQFDPSAFFEFDMRRGSVHARGGGRVLMLSEDVLAPLLTAAVQQGDLTAVRKLGTQLGGLVARGLGGAAEALPMRTVVAHAAGVLALYGWGRLAVERWGPALALVIDGAAPLDEDQLALAALLGGLFSQLASREVACVPVGSEGRYLVVDPAIAEQVWTWSREGDEVAAIVARLEDGQAEASRPRTGDNP